MPTNYAQKLKQFIQPATEEINPQYNAKVTALKNALAQNKLALEQQKTGVNQNYDNQVEDQNRNNKASKSNYSDILTNRGLGRSSIVATGIAEMDQINNRYVDRINQNRTGALGNIDSNIALEESNFNNTNAQMTADKQAEINNLARQYMYKQDETDYRDNQFSYQKQRDNVADKRYAQETATANSRYADSINYRNAQDAAKAREAQGISQEDITNSAWKAFAAESAAGKGQQYLENNQSDLIDAIGYSEYLKMLKEVKTIPLNSKTKQANYNDARMQHVKSYNQRPQY